MEPKLATLHLFKVELHEFLAILICGWKLPVLEVFAEIFELLCVITFCLVCLFKS